MAAELTNFPRESTLREVANALNVIAFAQAGNIGSIENWRAVQQLVRNGLGPQAFPVGTQLAVNHSVYGTRLFDVVAHDYLKSVHDESAHTMTIMQHDLLPSVQFDAPEAFYYAETQLAAGTYSFTIPFTSSLWEMGSYQFTLTNPVPAGGQLAIGGNSGARQVQSYASRTATSAIESVAITSGSGGTNLGTFGEELNYPHRVVYGSNNYKESAVRQFLNSSAAAGSVWVPQTKFDRPPTWITTLAGYMGGLDADFLAAVGEVVLPCSANNQYEAPDSTVIQNTAYTLNDAFYLASCAEVFGSHEVNDGSVLFPFYNSADNADRIKYRDGSAAIWWLRTPYIGHAHTARRVFTTGGMDISYVVDGAGIAPACTIV